MGLVYGQKFKHALKIFDELSEEYPSALSTLFLNLKGLAQLQVADDETCIATLSTVRQLDQHDLRQVDYLALLLRRRFIHAFLYPLNFQNLPIQHNNAHMLKRVFLSG